MESGAIETIRRKLRTDDVEDRILSLITDTPYQIGEKLPVEKELCSMFSVSRSTLREALKSLESRRVVYIKQGSGTYVRSWTPRDMDPLGIMKTENKLKTALDLVDVRLMLEPGIAALAAQKAEDEDRKNIMHYAEMVEKCIKEGKDYLQYDIDFHSAIAKASRNSVIEQLIPIIDTAVMMFVNVTHRELTEETVRTHRDIAEAIVSGDARQAEAAMNMHLLYNRQAIVDIIRKNGIKLV